MSVLERVICGKVKLLLYCWLGLGAGTVTMCWSGYWAVSRRQLLAAVAGGAALRVISDEPVARADLQRVTTDERHPGSSRAPASPRQCES
jgi:hypothetical protein